MVCHNVGCFWFFSEDAHHCLGHTTFFTSNCVECFANSLVCAHPFRMLFGPPSTFRLGHFIASNKVNLTRMALWNAHAWPLDLSVIGLLLVNYTVLMVQFDRHKKVIQTLSSWCCAITMPQNSQFLPCWTFTHFGTSQNMNSALLLRCLKWYLLSKLLSLSEFFPNSISFLIQPLFCMPGIDFVKQQKLLLLWIIVNICRFTLLNCPPSDHHVDTSAAKFWSPLWIGRTFASSLKWIWRRACSHLSWHCQ